MKFSKAAWLFALFFVAASAQAQMYKWVAPDGTVSYSDVPPPPTASKVERKSFSSGPSLSGLPYELAEVVKGNPVTLYTMANCAGCDSGRKLLKDRGVPFSEKTVASNEDIERVRQLSGNTQLPVLVVGRSKQTGFESGQWANALTAAGYPTSSHLPAGYDNPAPEPAAPPKTASNQSSGDAAKDATTTPSGIVKPPPPAGNAPPGFQF
jgi:glutaredoxin